MRDFFKQFFCGFDSRYSVIVEDDGRVCYAYLMEGKEIIGDVWLYNSNGTPTSVDWSAKEDLPFLNPLTYVNRDLNIVSNGPKDISIEWIMLNKLLSEANVFIKDKLVAKLKPGYKPGWSINASKDGPLAKSLS